MATVPNGTVARGTTVLYIAKAPTPTNVGVGASTTVLHIAKVATPAFAGVARGASVLHLAKAPGAPNGGPGASTTVPRKTAGTKPSTTKGKDGKVRAAKASKEVIIKAWAMKDSGVALAYPLVDN